MNAYEKLRLKIEKTSCDWLVMSREEFNEIGEFISSCKGDGNKEDEIKLPSTDYFILEGMVLSCMEEIGKREKNLGMYRLEVNRILSFIHKYFSLSDFNNIIRMMIENNIEVPYNLLMINGTIFDIDKKILHDDIDNVVKYIECIKRNRDDLEKFIYILMN